MSKADDWKAVRAELCSSGDPRHSPKFHKLYELATRDGRRILSSFRRIAEADRDDLIHDVLVRVLDHLLDAQVENPRAFFATALTRDATSAFRTEKRRNELVSVHLPEAHPHETHGRSDGRDQLLIQLQALESASPRDQQILIALGLGEPPQEVAHAFGLTRANVDQIVSRFRRRFRRDS